MKRQKAVIKTIGKKASVFLILTMIVAISALSGCIDSAEKSHFIGTWRTDLGHGDYMTIVFNTDDTYIKTVSKSGASQIGSWEIISDKEIRLYNDTPGEEFELIHEYRFQDNYNKLHLGAYVFVKQ